MNTREKQELIEYIEIALADYSYDKHIDNFDAIVRVSCEDGNASACYIDEKQLKKTK